MDFAILCQRYLEGDSRVAEFIRSRAELLAIGISNMLTMQPVQQIVLGGEIRQLGERFLDVLRNCISNVGFRRLTRNLEVRYAVNGEGAEIMGALWNYIENQMSMDLFAN
jgi:predicted NBD/HSP70 family sugar kinase